MTPPRRAIRTPARGRIALAAVVLGADQCGHDHGGAACPPHPHPRKDHTMTHARTAGRLGLTLTILGLAWAAVTSFGALAQACRYVELGEADA